MALRRAKWSSKLDDLIEEIKESPMYKERIEIQKAFERKKKGKYSIKNLFDKTEVCNECLVRVTCEKSFYNGSACKILEKRIKEKLNEIKVRFYNE